MRAAVLIAVLALSGCATATPPDSCTPAETPLPSEWAAWNTARPIAAGTAPDGLAATRFRTGEAIELALHPDPQVTYVSLPKGEGEAESFGGLAAFSVTRAGLYKVGLSIAAWVDVSGDGKPTPTAAFGPGPQCSPVRKVVSFELQPGDYVLEISGNKTPGIRVMVSGG